jgi:glycosyltransferase involved in cell wall biosynthesis
MHSAPVISIVICTYNRGKQLNDMLVSLKQSVDLVDRGKYEVIVIDNNSSDDTRKIVEKANDDMSIHYVFEKKQGLSNARNRAIQEFAGEWLLFTDDDVVIDSKWLQNYLALISKPVDAGFIGGRIVPLWQEPTPKWLKDENLAFFPGLLGKYDLGADNHFLSATEPTPCGANFAVSRSLIELVGSFRTDLGVVGRVPARGEETEYLYRAMSQGIPGYYSGKSLCYHLVDKKIFNLQYLYRFGVQKGIAAARMASEKPRSSWIKILDFSIRGLFQLMKGRGDRARQCLINIGIQRGIRLAE